MKLWRVSKEVSMHMYIRAETKEEAEDKSLDIGDEEWKFDEINHLEAWEMEDSDASR